MFYASLLLFYQVVNCSALEVSSTLWHPCCISLIAFFSAQVLGPWETEEGKKKKREAVTVKEIVEIFTLINNNGARLGVIGCYRMILGERAWNYDVLSQNGKGTIKGLLWSFTCIFSLTVRSSAQNIGVDAHDMTNSLCYIGQVDKDAVLWKLRLMRTLHLSLRMCLALAHVHVDSLCHRRVFPSSLSGTPHPYCPAPPPHPHPGSLGGEWWRCHRVSGTCAVLLRGTYCTHNLIIPSGDTLATAKRLNMKHLHFHCPSQTKVPALHAKSMTDIDFHI